MAEQFTEGYEEIKVHSKDGKHIGTITHGKYQSVAYAHPTTKFGGSKVPHPDEDSTTLAGPHETQKGIDYIHAHHRMVSEEVDQIDELSKDALKNYIPASAKDLSKKGVSAGIDAKSGKAGSTKDYGDHFQKRYVGILRATRKLAKEEVEGLDELSKSTLGSYVKKASADATISRKVASDFEHMASRAKKPSMKASASELEKEYKSKSWKRRDNIGKAVDRLTKEEVDLQEANHREFASQGKMHPDMAKHMTVGGVMDYYEHGTGDKVSGKVMKNNGKEVHVKQTHDSYNPKKVGTLHKFKISSSLDEKIKEEHMKTFKEFIEEAHEYKAGRYVHKGTYGTSHDDPGVKSKPFWQSADKDEDDKPKKVDAPAVKRGRGRPAGTKSGARQQGSGSGSDYSGIAHHSLNLPNSNK
jgi:hypothetical protein